MYMDEILGHLFLNLNCFLYKLLIMPTQDFVSISKYVSISEYLAHRACSLNSTTFFLLLMLLPHSYNMLGYSDKQPDLPKLKVRECITL